MNSYLLPILGSNKTVNVIPSLCLFEEGPSIQTNEVSVLGLQAAGDFSKHMDKRRDFFVEKRKDFLRKENKITKLFYLITPECKGRCSYCYASHSRDKEESGEKFLSYERFLEVCEVNNININEITDIQVLGGEPLLYVDELIKLALMHPDIIIGISTGLMVEMDVIEKTINTLCKLKNVSFSISIDPYYEDYARIYNGKRFYEEALLRLAMIDKATNMWGIRATISDSRQDVFSLERDVRNAIDDHKSFLSMTIDLLMGKAADDQTVTLENLFRWAKEKVDALLLSDREDMNDIETFEHFLPYPVKHFFPFFRVFGLMAVQQSSCCDVVTQRLAIDYSGLVNYCAESPMTEYADDWRFNGVDEQLIEKRVYSDELCKECDIFQYCGGVCFFNYHYYGVNEMQCKWWERTAILAMYALFNYHHKQGTLKEILHDNTRNN